MSNLSYVFVIVILRVIFHNLQAKLHILRWLQSAIFECYFILVNDQNKNCLTATSLHFWFIGLLLRNYAEDCSVNDTLKSGPKDITVFLNKIQLKQ